MKFNLLPFIRYTLLVVTLSVLMDYVQLSRGIQLGVILALVLVYPEPVLEYDDKQGNKDDSQK